MPFGVTVGLSQRGASGETPEGEDKLSVEIIAELVNGGSVLRACYFDGTVSLSDGKVGQVVGVATAAGDQIRPGDPVAGLPAGLETGTTIPLPVHIAADGTLRGGYAYCEEEENPF